MLAEGHHYFKMKVGSENHQDDVDRARAIRGAIGEDKHLMMDANQKWYDTDQPGGKDLITQRPYNSSYNSPFE